MSKRQREFKFTHPDKPDLYVWTGFSLMRFLFCPIWFLFKGMFYVHFMYLLSWLMMLALWTFSMNVRSPVPEMVSMLTIFWIVVWAIICLVFPVSIRIWHLKKKGYVSEEYETFLKKINEEPDNK
jgi:hypothetical protein